MSNKIPAHRIVKMPSEEEVKIAFERYAMAVGKVAHAWNYLHEKLGALFAVILRTDPQISSAVWHSTDSDRVKRGMLEKTILALPDARWPRQHPQAKNDLKWLLNQCNSLGDARNNAIHAPCILVTDSEGTEMKPSPPFFSGHARARKLEGKEILVEFDWCEQWAEGLSRFTEDAQKALLSASSSWPDKPSKPIRKRKIDLGRLPPT